MSRHRVRLLSALLCASTSFAGASEPTLYDRVAMNFEARPEVAAVLGKPSAELERARWMIGRWSVTARVFATRRAPERVERGESVVSETLGGAWLQFHDIYEGRVQDEGFLTFNPVAERWTAIGIDKIGNAIVATASKWDGDRIVFLAADAEILGQRVVLRQTIEKRSNDEYRVLNEERLPSGAWVALDEYVYTRMP